MIPSGATIASGNTTEDSKQTAQSAATSQTCSIVIEPDMPLDRCNIEHSLPIPQTSSKTVSVTQQGTNPSHKWIASTGYTSESALFSQGAQKIPSHIPDMEEGTPTFTSPNVQAWTGMAKKSTTTLCNGEVSLQMNAPVDFRPTAARCPEPEVRMFANQSFRSGYVEDATHSPCPPCNEGSVMIPMLEDDLLQSPGAGIKPPTFIQQNSLNATCIRLPQKDTQQCSLVQANTAKRTQNPKLSGGYDFTSRDTHTILRVGKVYSSHMYKTAAVVSESLPPAPTAVTVTNTDCISAPLPVHMKPASAYTTSSSMAVFNQSSTGRYTSRDDNFLVPLLPEDQRTLTPSQPLQDPLFITEWEEEEFNTEYDHTSPSELYLSNNTSSNTGYAQHVFTSTTTSEAVVVSESPLPAPTISNTNCLSAPLPAHPSSIQLASTYTKSSSMAVFNQSSTGGYTSEDDNFLVPLLPEDQCTLTPSHPLQDPLFITEWEEEEFNTEYDHTSPSESRLSLSNNTTSNTGYAQHVFKAEQSLPYQCTPPKGEPAAEVSTYNNITQSTKPSAHAYTTASQTIVFSQSPPPPPTLVSTNCLSAPLPAHPSSIQSATYATSSSMAALNQSGTGEYTSEDDNFLVPLLPEDQCTLTPSQPLQDPLFITEWEEEEFNTEYDHTSPSELYLSNNTTSNTGYAQHVFKAEQSLPYQCTPPKGEPAAEVSTCNNITQSAKPSAHAYTTASQTIVFSQSPPPPPTLVSTNCLSAPLPAHPSSIQSATYTTSSSMAAFNQSGTGGYTSEDDNFLVPLLPEEQCTLTPSQPLQDPLFITEWEEEEFNTEYDHTSPPSELSLSNNTASNTGYAQHVFTAVAGSITTSESVVVSQSLPPAPTVTNTDCISAPLPVHMKPATTYTTSSSMAVFNQSGTGGYSSEDDDFLVPLLPEEQCTLTPSQPLEDPLFITEWEEEEFNTEYDHISPPSELSLSNKATSNTGYAQHVFTAVASSTITSEAVVVSESQPPTPTVINTDHCLSAIQLATTYTTSSSMAAFNQSGTGGYTSEDDNFLVPLLPEDQCTLTPSQPLQDPLFITEWEEEEFNTEYDHTSPSELYLSNNTTSNTGYAQHVFKAEQSLPYQCTPPKGEPAAEVSTYNNITQSTKPSAHGYTTASQTIVFSQSPPPPPTLVSTKCLSAPLPAHPSSIQSATYATSSSMAALNQSGTGRYTSKDDNFLVPLLPEDQCTLTPSQPLQDPLFITEWEEEEFNTEYDHTSPPSELSLSNNTASNTGYAQHVFTAVAGSITTSESVVVSQSLPPAPTVTNTDCISAPLPVHMKPATTYTTSSSMAVFNQSGTGGYSSEDDDFLVPLLPEEQCTLTPSQPLEDPLFITEWEEEEFNTEYDHISPPSELSLSNKATSNTGYAQHVFTAVASFTTTSEAVVVSESQPPTPTVINTDHCLSAIQLASTYTKSSSMAAFNQSGTGGYTSEDDNFLFPLLPEDQCTLTPSQPLQDPLFITEWEEEEFNTEYDHTSPSELYLSNNTTSNTGYAQHVFKAEQSLPYQCTPPKGEPAAEVSTCNNITQSAKPSAHAYTTASQTIVFSQSPPPPPTLVSTKCLSAPLPAHPSSIQSATYATSSSMAALNQSGTGGYTSEDDNFLVPLLPEDQCTLTPSQPLQDPLFITEWKEEEFNTEYDHTSPPSELSLSNKSNPDKHITIPNRAVLAANCTQNPFQETLSEYLLDTHSNASTTPDISLLQDDDDTVWCKHLETTLTIPFPPDRILSIDSGYLSSTDSIASPDAKGIMFPIMQLSRHCSDQSSPDSSSNVINVSLNSPLLCPQHMQAYNNTHTKVYNQLTFDGYTSEPTLFPTNAPINPTSI